DKSADPHWATIGAGHSSQGNFLAVEFYPSIHDLMGRDEGFVRFSEIEVLGLSSRYYPNSKNMTHWQLDSLKLFSMSNFVPFEPYDHELSWRVNLEVTSRKEIARADAHRGELSSALGLGTRFFNDVYIYALFGVSLESGSTSGPAVNSYLGPEAGS